MNRLQKSWVCAAALFAAASAFAYNTTYYVSAADGNDANDGTSWATAFKTLTAVFGPSMTGTQWGRGHNDTVMIKPGTYYVTNSISLTGCSMIGSTGNPADVIIDGQDKSALVMLGYNSKWAVGSATLSGITFQHGREQASGAFWVGAVALVDHANHNGNVLTNCVIRDCAQNPSVAPEAGRVHALCAGGGVYLYEGTIADCRIENCRLTSSCASDDRYYGGGLATFSTRPKIRNVVITNCVINATSSSGNACGGGYGVYIENNSCYVTNLTVAGCSVYRNGSLSGEGGGIYARPAGTFLDCRVANCKARSYGGMYCGAGCILRGCTIENNVASYRYGGLGLDGGGHLVEFCRVDGNEAGTDSYGGLSMSGSGIVLRDVTVCNNVCTNGSRAGINVSGASNALITNCVVVGNVASPTVAEGGGIGISGSLNLLIVDTIISSNSAYRGAIIMYADYGGNRGNGMTLRNCYMAGNKIREQGGIYAGGNAILTNRYDHCTIVDNTGGDIFRWHGYVSSTVQSNQWINACVFAGNSRDFTLIPGVGVNIQNTYGWNITKAKYPYADTFVDAGNHDYRPRGLSVLVDYPMTDWPAFGDFDWMQGGRRKDMGDGSYALEPVGANGVRVTHPNAGYRISGAGPDLGCFEYQHSLGLTVIFY